MNECDLFMAALEFPSLEERAEFLDRECGPGTPLRQRVETLLNSHSQAGSLLEHPAVDVAATECRTDNGATAASIPEAPRRAALTTVSLDFLPPSDDKNSLGRLGQHEVLEVVGHGGMGIVFKARDTRLHRIVAVKVLAPELAANPTARKRFLREAQAAAAVSHDQIVTIHAVEETPLPYLVMEFIDGQSLQEKLDQDGPLELKEILRIGRQIAAGLAAAHAQGLIHRDVKPANILLQNGIQRVQITDFGLARAVDDVGLTHTGQITGTPQYMSPEQAQGKSIDQRSDLFSLGSVLYAMCTGHSPFGAETTMGALRRVCDESPRPIRELNPDIPDWLAAIVNRLLAKNADERFQTAAEVDDLLSQHLAALQNPSATAFPAATLQTASQHRRPGRRRLAAALIFIAVLAGLSVAEGTGVTHFVATVLRISTPEGTLIVEVDDPSVNVTIEGDGGLVITGAGAQEVRLRPGSYRIQADKDGRAVAVEKELVTITRGDKQIVRVRIEAEAATAKAPDKPEPQAFVVLAGKRVSERQFATLAEAVRGASDGGTIEIRGNGPFVTDPIDILALSLTIRAGDGFHPTVQLNPRAAGPLLRSKGDALNLEGIEFLHQPGDEAPVDKYPNIVRKNGGTLTVANCRFVLTHCRLGACVNCNLTPRAELRNSEFIRLGPDDGGCGIAWNCPPTGTLLVENCIDTGWYDFLVPMLDVTQARDVSIRVRNTTSSAEVGIYVMARGIPLAPADLSGAFALSLESARNVFDSRAHVFVFLGQEDENGPSLPVNMLTELCRRHCRWHDEGSLYPHQVSLGIYPGARAGKATVQATAGLEAWNAFWTQESPGSLSGTALFQGGDVYARARAVGQRVQPKDFRLRPDSPGYRAGPDGKDLGADIDLVGPGAAYERWKKTPAYQEWLKETGQLTDHAETRTERQAFVRLASKDVPERKFETLAEAVLAASDGDTIEIRGNGPFVTQPISIVGHALTIRAGQAYRPVIRLKQEGLSDGTSMFVTDATLVLEGLELRFVGPGNQEQPKRGPDAVVSNGAPLYLANCTLVKRQNLPRGGLLQLLNSSRCELRNCQFLAVNGSLLNWGFPADHGEFVMDNCVGGGNVSINFDNYRHNARDFSIQIRRTTAVTPQRFLYLNLDRPLDLPTQVIRVAASDNVFETGPLFTLNQSPTFYQASQPLAADPAQAIVSHLLHWHGERNLYSVSRGFLTLSVGNGGTELLPLATPIETLEAWNRFLNTEDADSLEGQARYQGGALLARTRTAVEQLTPDDFRLRPDSAGYRAGPDGKDLGADVDLVGPGAAYERWKQTPEYQEWLKETGQSQDRAPPQLAPLESNVPADRGAAARTDTAQNSPGREMTEMRRFEGHQAIVWSVAFSPDGSRALSGSGMQVRNGRWTLGSDFTVRLWDVASARQLHSFAGYNHAVQSVAFTPDGRHAVGAGKTWACRRWDVETGQELPGFPGDPGKPFFHLALSNDAGRLLTWGGKDKVLRLWDVATGTELWNFEGLSEEVSAAAFSTDGRYVATAGGGTYEQLEQRLKPGSDYSIRLWNAVSGKEEFRLRGHTEFVRGLAFLPDGRRLLSGGADNVLRLWDLQTHEELQVYQGHKHAVNSIAISQDGRWVLSGSGDTTVRLWDIETAKELCRYVGHKGEVRSVAISSDRRLALSGGEDETIRLWQLPKPAE